MSPRIAAVFHALLTVALVAHAASATRRKSTERRNLSSFSCGGTGNPIDDCWRCDPNWNDNRRRLSDCAIGFGRNAVGGRDGEYYLVTDPSDDDVVKPKVGTLRHAAVQSAPLWIIFNRDMVITLKQELIVNSFKTIDGRGVDVHIANGGCITMRNVSNVIIHGIHIHDCKPIDNADGDGISIYGSKDVWIDHNSLSSCSDGLIDAIMGSTSITISNNYFSHHNEVMLLGHNDSYTGDSIMRVTVAYNRFGEDLNQRMPRCRHGYFHIVNNDYLSWGMYAIGGSANPTIYSQGNRFLAADNASTKEVTKRIVSWGDDDKGWRQWNWRSDGDLFVNGAYFVSSGDNATVNYSKTSSIGAQPAYSVSGITMDAGVLHCRKGFPC